MKTGFRAKLRFTERLGFRLAFLLSVALLPLGLIALAQTWQMAQNAERAAEAALVQRTSDIVAGERALIQGAMGAAGALGQAVLENLDNAETCSSILADYVDRSSIYSFAGFIPASGLMTCSSALQPIDVSQTGTYRSFMASPGPTITANPNGMVSREAVVVVTEPVARNGALLGMLSVAIPHRTLKGLRSSTDDHVDVVILNRRGEALYAEDHGLATVSDLLPRAYPESTGGTDRAVFREANGAGQPKVFARFAAIPGLLQVVGAWEPESAQLGRDLISPTALLFPLTMWLTSLVVAYAAVDRLVIRHVRELRGQMRRFALGRRETPPDVLKRAPAEIQDVSQTFHNLARILIRDEAELAASLSEKTVLLKEIHHRVKNNLQLIASIMNMQIRQVKEPGARRVLRSVQDRVASLATIHRNLYQAETLAAVQADHLLNDIVNQMMVLSVAPGSNLKIDSYFDTVTLAPDQAVPVSLLATEALTNAVKYSTPATPGDMRWIRISLTARAGSQAELTIENSRGDKDPLPPDDVTGSGLGSQLINAFAGQLGSQVEITEPPGAYRLTIRFEVEASTVA